jgi:anti-sigma B factor antagonist
VNGETPDLAVEVVDDPDGDVVVSVTGEIDLSNAEAFRLRLGEVLGRHPPMITLDLSGLEFLDSSGIAVMVGAAREAEGIRVRNASPIVRRVFEVTGLVDLFGLDQP